MRLERLLDEQSETDQDDAPNVLSTASSDGSPTGVDSKERLFHQKLGRQIGDEMNPHKAPEQGSQQPAARQSSATYHYNQPSDHELDRSLARRRAGKVTSPALVKLRASDKYNAASAEQKEALEKETRESVTANQHATGRQAASTTTDAAALSPDSEATAPGQHSRNEITPTAALAIDCATSNIQNSVSVDQSEPDSPAWSSDSDNRLIKAINAGKSGDALHQVFPTRYRHSLERRRTHLVQKGVFGRETISQTVQNPALQTRPLSPPAVSPPAIASPDILSPSSPAKRTPACKTPTEETMAVNPETTGAGRPWSLEEDEILIARVKTGEKLDQIAQKTSGRSTPAIRARMIRLNEGGKITASERQASISNASGAGCVMPPRWTVDEDSLIVRALREGKTSAQAAGLLPHRTEDAVLRRRRNLVDLGKLGPELTFATPSRSEQPRSVQPTASTKHLTKGKLWSHEEDEKLRSLVVQDLPWSEISSHFVNRSASSVANRWAKIENTSSMPPPAVKGPVKKVAGLPWSEEEDQRLIGFVKQGMRWSQMDGLFGDRSVGSFANRYALLEKRGHVPAAIQPSLLESLNDDFDSNRGLTARRSTRGDSMAGRENPRQNGRKRARRESLGAADDADDSTSDENDLDDAPGSKRRRLATDDGRRATTSSLYGPCKLPDRRSGRPAQNHTGPRRRTQPPANSVDRLSGYSATESDGDTIVISRPPPSTGTRSIPRKRNKKSATIFNAFKQNTSPARSKASASRTEDDAELDEALAAHESEIDALKARLAKHEKLAQQKKEIADLKKRLGRFTSDPI